MAEDCLLEIFSFLSANIMDMCAVAETCQRLRSIGQRVIRRNFHFHMSLKPFTSLYIFKWGKRNYESDEQTYVERIFRNFGSCLSQVTVFVYEQQERFALNLINKHCCDELKTLMIFRYSAAAAPEVELEPVFKRLQTVYFQFVFIEKAAILFRKLDSLVELDVNCVTNCSTILESVFPRLEKFSYYKFQVVKGNQMTHSGEQHKLQQSLERLLIFIRRHSGLKAITFGFVSDQNCWTAIMHTIGCNCTKLQELNIKIRTKDNLFSSVPLKSLQTVTSLRAIRLHNVCFGDFEMFRTLMNLRELDLAYCRLPKNINQFAHVAQISRFCLVMHEEHSSAIRYIDAVGIIRWLINLENFLISAAHNVFVLNETKFVQIADLVKERPNVLALTCNSTVTRSAWNLKVTKM